MARRRRPEFQLLIWTLIFAALTVVILITRPMTTKPAKPRPDLHLKVADDNGRMRVDWDASNPAIQSAQGGTLEVEDGGVFNRYPVEAKILRSGGLDYVRRSEDVLLTLTLFHDGRPGAQSTVRRIAPIQTVAQAEEAPVAQRTRRSQRQVRTRRR